jgi:hypothetical protein
MSPSAVGLGGPSSLSLSLSQGSLTAGLDAIGISSVHGGVLGPGPSGATGSTEGGVDSGAGIAVTDTSGAAVQSEAGKGGGGPSGQGTPAGPGPVTGPPSSSAMDDDDEDDLFGPAVPPDWLMEGSPSTGRDGGSGEGGGPVGNTSGFFGNGSDGSSGGTGGGAGGGGGGGGGACAGPGSSHGGGARGAGSPGSQHPVSPTRAAQVTGRVVPATGLRRDGLRLLQELCSAARLVRPGVRAAFFNALYQSEPNVLSSVESVVRDPTACARHVVISMDVLFALMQQDPARLRAHILAQKNHPQPPASIAVASTPGAKPVAVKPTVRPCDVPQHTHTHTLSTSQSPIAFCVPHPSLGSHFPSFSTLPILPRTHSPPLPSCLCCRAWARRRQ